MKTYNEINCKQVRFIHNNNIAEFEQEVNNMFELYRVLSFEWRIGTNQHYGMFILYGKRDKLKEYKKLVSRQKKE